MFIANLWNTVRGSILDILSVVHPYKFTLSLRNFFNCCFTSTCKSAPIRTNFAKSSHICTSVNSTLGITFLIFFFWLPMVRVHSYDLICRITLPLNGCPNPSSLLNPRQNVSSFPLSSCILRGGLILMLNDKHDLLPGRLTQFLLPLERYGTTF